MESTPQLLTLSSAQCDTPPVFNCRFMPSGLCSPVCHPRETLLTKINVDLDVARIEAAPTECYNVPKMPLTAYGAHSWIQHGAFAKSNSNVKEIRTEWDYCLCCALVLQQHVLACSLRCSGAVLMTLSQYNPSARGEGSICNATCSVLHTAGDELGWCPRMSETAACRLSCWS